MYTAAKNKEREMSMSLPDRSYHNFKEQCPVSLYILHIFRVIKFYFCRPSKRENDFDSRSVSRNSIHIVEVITSVCVCVCECLWGGGSFKTTLQG